MRKSLNILTLFLTILTIISLFSVVAFAEDETVPKAVNVGGFGNELDFDDDDDDFDRWPIGATWGEGSGDGIIGIQEAYPDGNRFLHLTGTRTAYGTSQYLAFLEDESGKEQSDISSTYALGNYPIIALDFDIMTPNGDWGLYSASNSGNNAGINFERGYIGDVQQSDDSGIGKLPISQISFGNLGLPSTSYVWHHVTVIYEYYTSTENGETAHYLKQTAYADGNLVTNKYCTKDKISLSKYGDDVANLWIGPLTIKTSKHETTSQQAIDNIEITYCQEGYDTTKLVNAIYNETWEAPFGKLIATVSVGEDIYYFDDVSEASDFAKVYQDSQITLTDNITSTYFVDCAVTIDARKLDAQGNLTGQVYTGVLDNIRTKEGYYLQETESGVFVAQKGDFVIFDANGLGIAYLKDEFATKFKAVNIGYTVKLLGNIETEASFTLTSKFNNVTLDLNGYNLVRISYGGTLYEATKDESGDFIFGTDNPTTVSATSSYLFDYSVSATTNFKITSSVPGASIANLTVTAETWKYNGEVVKRVITEIVGASLFRMNQNNAVLEITNASIYGSGFVVVDNSSYGNQKILLNSINYYQINDGHMINSKHKKNFTLDVKNSLILLQNNNVDSSLFLFSEASSSASYVTKVSFTGCDIIKDGLNSYGIDTTVNAGTNTDLLYDNCRVYGLSNASVVKGINGTLGYYQVSESSGQSSYAPAVPDGYEQYDVNISIDYTVPDVFTAKTSVGLVESISIPTEVRTITRIFNKVNTKAVNVNWVDADRETVLKKTQLIPGVSNLETEGYRYIKELKDNDYLNVLYQWSDEKGRELNDILGLSRQGIDWQDTYTFYANENLNGVTEYVGGIKDAQFNLNFLSGFRYNLYLPVDDKLNVITVEGFEKVKNYAFIDGKEYLLYSKIVGTAEAAESNTIFAKFTVDGLEYTQTWSINAIVYADMLLSYSDNKYPNEKVAIGSMAKFIKEAALLTEGSTADIEAIESLIAKSGVCATYADYIDGNVNALNTLYGAVTNVQYIVFNGVAAYRFTLATDNTDISFKVNGASVNFTRNGNIVTLDSMRVYDIIEPITVISGDKTATFTMVDYLTGMESGAGENLAKALYEFGLAADKYKKDLIANN